MLTENKRLELSRIAPVAVFACRGYVFRAKLILLLAEGASYQSIKVTETRSEQKPGDTGRSLLSLASVNWSKP